MPLKSLRAWFLRLCGIFHKEHFDRDLHAELASHLEMHIEENLRAGMNVEEARRVALIKLAGSNKPKNPSATAAASRGWMACSKTRA
jgi:macrolide transport system ATP-binding/permease protein